LEDRIIELETRLAHQELTIEELNQIVTKQQNELATLTLAIQKLHEQMKQLTPSDITSQNQEMPPPHY